MTTWSWGGLIIVLVGAVTVLVALVVSILLTYRKR
jgi:hypothetical protein